MYSFPNFEPLCCSTSSSNCCFLSCIQASQETGKVVWYSHLLNNFPQFVVINMVKGFHVVNEAEVDIFLEFPCLVYDSVDVGNLIPGSFVFSKSSLYIWKYMVHVLLKLNFKDFEPNLVSKWNECNCMVIENSLALPFFGIEMENDLFQSGGHWWVFQIYWHFDWSTSDINLDFPSFENLYLTLKDPERCLWQPLIPL